MANPRPGWDTWGVPRVRTPAALRPIVWRSDAVPTDEGVRDALVRSAWALEDLHIAIVDADARILQVNHSRVDPSLFLGKTMAELSTDPHTGNHITEAVRAAIELDRPTPFAAASRLGGVGRGVAHPIRSDEVVRALVVLADMTEVQHAHEQRHRANARFRELLERIDLPAFIFDVDGTLLFANEQLARALGWPLAELVGTNYIEHVVPPEERASVHARVEALRNLRPADPDAKRSNTAEYEVLTASGSRRCLRWHSVVVPVSDGPPLIASIGEDLTDARRLSSTLDEVERVANIGHWEWDIETNALAWSNETYALFGIPAGSGEPTYPNFLDKVHPEDRARVEAGVAQALAGHAPYNVRHRLLRPDGTIRWAHERAEVVEHDQQGRPKRMLGTVHDITDMVAAEEALRASEERLQQAQQLEALGSLAAGVAHDFNNFLTVILGFSKLLMQDTEEQRSTATRSGLTQIHRAAERAAALTQQLLAFGRRQLIRPDIVALEPTIRAFAHMARQLIGNNIEVEFDFDPGVPSVVVDPVQLERILLNLAINARDAMPNGGRLIFGAGRQRLADNGVAEDGKDYGAFWVTDTGQGMDADTRRRIFEPFFTTKARGKGTGLGLATVYGAVRQSGGHIFVDSAPGLGSTFTVHLPSHEIEKDGKQARDRRRRTKGLAGRGEAVVLVVDDDPDVRAVACAILLRRGYRVLAGQSAAECLAIASQVKEISLILVDVVMPELSGPEFIRRVQGVRPDILVLFMSGHADDITLRHGVERGTVQMVEKPLTPERLVAAVEALLAGMPVPRRMEP